MAPQTDYNSTLSRNIENRGLLAGALIGSGIGLSAGLSGSVLGGIIGATIGYFGTTWLVDPDTLSQEHPISKEARNIIEDEPVIIGNQKKLQKLNESEDNTDKPNILIVDDEAPVASTYKLWLQEDYNVRIVNSGQEASDELSKDIDIVLLDRNMPGLSGEEILKEINERDLGCLVALVTALEPDYDIIDLEFDAYLSKPVTSKELKQTVENLLDRSQYSNWVQDYYSLYEKISVLEATKSESELMNDEEYQAIKEKIEQMGEIFREKTEEYPDHQDY